MTLLKQFVGVIAFPILWLWAWLSPPKDGNKEGLDAGIKRGIIGHWDFRKGPDDKEGPK